MENVFFSGIGSQLGGGRMQMSKSTIWGGLAALGGVVPYITLTLVWGGAPPVKSGCPPSNSLPL